MKFINNHSVLRKIHNDYHPISSLFFSLNLLFYQQINLLKLKNQQKCDHFIPLNIILSLLSM